MPRDEQHRNAADYVVSSGYLCDDTEAAWFVESCALAIAKISPFGHLLIDVA